MTQTALDFDGKRIRDAGAAPLQLRRPVAVGSVRHGHAAGRGFTLLEVIIALTVFLLLAGATIIGVGSWRDGAKLETGVERFETMMRMAQADAAYYGRRLRLRIHEADGSFEVLWEAEPLTEPNVFVPYTMGSWANSVPSDLVSVRVSQYMGDSSYLPMMLDDNSEMEQPDDRLVDVVFYPDGSSDSAHIELFATEDDVLVGVIHLDGVNGTIDSHVMAPVEYDDYMLDMAEFEGFVLVE